MLGWAELLLLQFEFLHAAKISIGETVFIFFWKFRMPDAFIISLKNFLSNFEKITHLWALKVWLLRAFFKLLKLFSINYKNSQWMAKIIHSTNERFSHSPLQWNSVKWIGDLIYRKCFAFCFIHLKDTLNIKNSTGNIHLVLKKRKRLQFNEAVIKRKDISFSW